VPWCKRKKSNTGDRTKCLTNRSDQSENTTNSAPGGESYLEDPPTLSDLEHAPPNRKAVMYIGDTTPRGLPPPRHEVGDPTSDRRGRWPGHATHGESVSINVDGSVSTRRWPRHSRRAGTPSSPKNKSAATSPARGVRTVLNRRQVRQRRPPYQNRRDAPHGSRRHRRQLLSRMVRRSKLCRGWPVYHKELRTRIPKPTSAAVGPHHQALLWANQDYVNPIAIFPNTKLHLRPAIRSGGLQELAFLKQGVRITIADDRHRRQGIVQYDDGLGIRAASQPRERSRQPTSVTSKADEKAHVEVPLHTRPRNRNRHPTSTLQQHRRGTHFPASARTDRVNQQLRQGRRRGLFKVPSAPSGEIFREGLTAPS